MRTNMSWHGPGHSYDYPSASSIPFTTANQVSRWMPYKIVGNVNTIMAPKASNRSGQSWEQVHAGVKSAAISDNFRKS